MMPWLARDDNLRGEIRLFGREPLKDPHDLIWQVNCGLAIGEQGLLVNSYHELLELIEPLHIKRGQRVKVKLVVDDD